VAPLRRIPLISLAAVERDLERGIRSTSLIRHGFRSAVRGCVAVATRRDFDSANRFVASKRSRSKVADFYVGNCKLQRIALLTDLLRYPFLTCNNNNNEPMIAAQVKPPPNMGHDVGMGINRARDARGR